MAKCIMIQGTMSNVGKSAIAAGLCRVLKQDGYKVAPFKSQNMALNSFITQNGLEMGRAQVMQAEAAGIEPEVSMNPILLKPTNDTGSQVIINGKPIGVMSAVEYYRHKRDYIPYILEAYRELEKKYDVIVIEGAGSPAEINLKKDDIVNMGMAELVDAPVLLVGDIDRGGVFAQIAGTVMLLEEKERKRIAGTVINKFRGDVSILEPGLKMLEDRTDIPVLGVVPYFYLDLDEEDSLTERFHKKEKPGLVDIAVIRFPRISNFTDLAPLEAIKEVSVRYISSPADFGQPDLVILPGSKNTISDLLWMRQNGLEAAVLKKAAGGTPIWGICGGYQMMGQTLSDQEGTEAGVPGRTISGMGLLPLQTQFQEEKTRTQVKGCFGTVSGIFSGLSGMEAEGYEIHMGETSSVGGDIVKNVIKEQEKAVNHSLLKLREEQAGNHTEKQDGCCRDNLYGTYVHGIFDKAEVAETIVCALMKEKGMEPEVGGLSFDYEKYREEQYNRLADTMRKYLDMEAIYRILEEGV